MKMELNIPDYLAERGLHFEWEPASSITVKIDGGTTILSANRDGLVPVARHLLTLAQAEVPPGAHMHLDESTGLEDGSSELILEKI